MLRIPKSPNRETAVISSDAHAPLPRPKREVPRLPRQQKARQAASAPASPGARRCNARPVAKAPCATDHRDFDASLSLVASLSFAAQVRLAHACLRQGLRILQ